MSKASHASSSDSNKIRRIQDEPTPVDTGLIRCICPSTEDDGFTIQCERCLVWQHAYCVQITHETIPDHYLCDRCSKRKRPKLSKRFTISKKKLKKLDAEDDPSIKNKKRKHVKSRIVSRYVYPIFKEAKERWGQNSRFKQHQETTGPLLYDHGPFVTMDAVTLLTKGVLIDTPVSNQGLFATRSIPSLRYLMEVTGDVLLKSEFKFDPINDFVILGTPLSHIMFYPTLDLCIDTRQFGNKARYIRRSCHPNAELRNVVLSRDDKTIHLGLFARHLIEKGQEVTISWNWQRGHIAWKENMNWHHQHKLRQGQDDEGHQVIDEEEERRRKLTIQNMLDRFEKEFGACACLNKRRCLIEQLRRQIVPPREKPVFKLPAVNILPAIKPERRKSSVILLKPKPELESKTTHSRQFIVSPTSSTTIIKKGSGVEESLDIDVTSNSPTLGTEKDVSDDELVDVEGDIDIGDDLPVSDNMKDNLPLLEDNSSDEDDNGDLSSLSSLSSLSVFEESGNDMTDDEDRRSKARRKKGSRHHKSSRSHHNRPVPSSTSSIPAAEKTSPIAPSILPRKKLWMRDYFNKHTSEAKFPDTTEQLPKPETSLASDKKLYTNAEEVPSLQKEPSSSMNESKSAIKADTNNELMQINEKAAINHTHPSDDTLTSLPTLQIEEKINSMEEKTDLMEEKAVPMEITDTVVTDEHKMDIDVNNEIDIDEGELSDASTIQLDEEEIRHVYEQQPLVAENTLPEVSTSSKVEQNDSLPEETVNDSSLLVTESQLLHSKEIDPPQPTNIIIPTEEKITMEDEEKKSVKKISLQEYLSTKQKSIQP